MAKTRTTYICQGCGAASPRWMGKCPDCGAWNSYAEELLPAKKSKTSRSAETSTVRPVRLSDIPPDREMRIPTTCSEFDRVLGGGIVPGGVTLVGGAPGMGKSTLMLQICGTLAGKGKKILYISGEESAAQIRMRADRLGVSHDGFLLLCETDLEAMTAAIRHEKPDIAVLDSIQTVFSGEFESLPGNIGQVRYSGHILTGLAKETHMPLFLIGHVTKEGTLAGPRVLEHLVDCLLLFEGDDRHFYRLLRSVKNRFGSTQEIGIFEMTDRGMREIPNPSEHLISNRDQSASGSCITVSLEGTRALLVEVQALVTPTSYGVPQRTATGFDHRRLSMLIAVLEKRLGLRFGNQDVFVNTAGGLRLNEPGVDLAVALAMVSSLNDRVLPSDAAFVGEIGLSGEVRGVTRMAQRVSEAARLGFRTLILPENGLKGIAAPESVRIHGVRSIRNVMPILDRMK
ncbi:MAG TPA: DNA repair protein RadA [bacterium]|nr:DNA repair protein RadA [bacterium]